MCRHLCPVGLRTGEEVSTPRTKGLLFSMMERGTAFDRGIAEMMYECLLYDVCSNNRATGLRPPVFIQEGRTAAVVEGLVSEEMQAVLDKIEVSDGAYEEVKPSFRTKRSVEVLVYVEEVAALRAQNMAESSLHLSERAGVSYTVLKEEPASGVTLAGLIEYVKEVQETARVYSDAINRTGMRAVVVPGNYDAVFTTQQYGEWGMGLQAGVVTATSCLALLLREGKLRSGKISMTYVAHHNDSRLARGIHESESVGELIEVMDIKLEEVLQNRELAECHDTSPVRACMPEIVAMAARGRWEDVMQAKVETLIVASSEVQEVVRGAVPEGMKLCGLFGLLDRTCS